jgi:hypothetical protein
MFSEQLLANIDTDIKFYRRNRVLMGACLLYAAITALTLIPSFIFGSSTQEFTILKNLHDSLSTAVTVIVALMGLLFMSSHFRNRNVKMVLTKPCSPETWLAGIVVSTLGVLFVLQVVVVLITGILFAVWGIPFQAGLLYVTVENFLADAVILSFIIFLSTAMPPVLAAIVAVIANEGAIYALREIVTAGQQSHGSTGLAILDGVLYVVYMALPSYGLLGNRDRDVYETWHLKASDWMDLLPALGYTAAIVVLFYLLTIVVLRRKSLG